MSINRKIGLEIRNGHEVGRDPRDMTADELNALGHQSMSPLNALRLRCVDCSGDSANEVRLCTVVRCPAWPFRMGKNPWRVPASDKQRDRARASLAATRARLAKIPGQEPGLAKFQQVPATTLPADIADRRDLEKSSSKPEGSRNGGDASPQHAERVDGGAQ